MNFWESSILSVFSLEVSLILAHIWTDIWNAIIFADMSGLSNGAGKEI